MRSSGNWRRSTMLVRLVTLSTTMTLAMACVGGGNAATTGEGAFCRLYQPIPVSEGNGPAVQANEVTYCALCDPTCPEAVLEAWEERRGG